MNIRGDETRIDWFTAARFIRAVGAIAPEVAHFALGNALPARPTHKLSIGAAVGLDGGGCGGHCGVSGTHSGKLSCGRRGRKNTHKQGEMDIM